MLWAVGVGRALPDAHRSDSHRCGAPAAVRHLPTLYEVDEMTGAIVVRPYQANNSCFGLAVRT